MRALSPATPLPWVVMLMEAGLVYLLAYAWFGGADGRAPLAPLVAVSLTPLGYLFASLSPRLLRGPWWPWLAGALLSLMLNALAQAPRPETDLVNACVWRLGQAAFPALVGLGLWWRGRYMAHEEDLAEHAQREFTLIGGALVLVLGLYGHLVPTDAGVRTAAVLVYLGSGLLAVGLARQQEAGSPLSAGSVTLVGICAVGLLVIAAVFVALLQPDVLKTIAGVLQAAVTLLIQLLLLPFLLLFEWLHLEMPALPADSGGAGPAPIDASERADVPDWVEWLLGAVMLIGAAFTTLMLLVAAAYLVWEVWQRLARRLGGRGRAPIAVETEGGVLQDAVAALAALRAWLARLAGRGGSVPAEPAAIRSVRAAYRALLRWAKTRGLERDPWETPTEFQTRLATRVPDAAEHAAVLTAAYEAMRYGDIAPGDHEVERLRSCVERLSAIPA